MFDSGLRAHLDSDCLSFVVKNEFIKAYLVSQAMTLLKFLNLVAYTHSLQIVYKNVQAMFSLIATLLKEHVCTDLIKQHSQEMDGIAFYNMIC